MDNTKSRHIGIAKEVWITQNNKNNVILMKLKSKTKTELTPSVTTAYQSPVGVTIVRTIHLGQ